MVVGEAHHDFSSPESNEIMVRRGTVADIDSLVEICRAGFPHGIRWQGSRSVARKWWKLYVDSSAKETWVCLSNGKVAGFIVLMIDQSAANKENQKRRPGLFTRMSALMFCPKVVLSRVMRLTISYIRKNRSLSVTASRNTQPADSDHSEARELTWIALMAVSPHMRRRGLAKKMLRFAEVRTWALKGKIIKVNPESFNKPAISLYEKAGFVRTSQSSGYIYYTKLLNQQDGEEEKQD